MKFQFDPTYQHDSSNIPIYPLSPFEKATAQEITSPHVQKMIARIDAMEQDFDNPLKKLKENRELGGILNALDRFLNSESGYSYSGDVCKFLQGDDGVKPLPTEFNS